MVGFPIRCPEATRWHRQPRSVHGKTKGRERTEQPQDVAIDGGSDGMGEAECDEDGTREGSDVEVLTREGFFRRPPPARKETKPQN